MRHLADSECEILSVSNTGCFFEAYCHESPEFPKTILYVTKTNVFDTRDDTYATYNSSRVVWVLLICLLCPSVFENSENAKGHMFMYQSLGMDTERCHFKLK